MTSERAADEWFEASIGVQSVGFPVLGLVLSQCVLLQQLLA